MATITNVVGVWKGSEDSAYKLQLAADGRGSHAACRDPLNGPHHVPLVFSCATPAGKSGVGQNEANVSLTAHSTEELALLIVISESPCASDQRQGIIVKNGKSLLLAAFCCRD
jgi:hypothetical protein